MKLKTLDTKHAEYDAQEWAECRALYAGGKRFKNMVSTFLPRNPDEMPDIYEARKRVAYYRSYVGPIIDYYASWLFSGAFGVRAKDAATGKETPTKPVYAQFYADIGGDKKLPELMRERFTDALKAGRSYWLVRFDEDGGPEPESLAEFSNRGLGRAELVPVEREDVYDWKVDEHGKLEWITLHSIDSSRKSPRDESSMVREQWCIYDQTTCETFAIEYEKGKRPKEDELVPSVGIATHRFKEVPIVVLDIPEGMWVGARTKAAQIEHFQMSSALGWAIRRTCYAMPVLNLEDDEALQTQGAGYAIKLGPNDKYSWTAPPSTPYDIIGKEVDSQRDEIYRICHQMAMGLDNNADTVGRSADSKEMDTAATRVMLNAYGSLVSKAIEATYEIVSDALGDEDTYWSVEGFSGYDTAKAPQLIATASDVQNLQIPSKTFRCEMHTKVALATLPEIDQHKKDNIRTEISDAYAKLPTLEVLAIPAMDNAKLAPRAPDGEAPPLPPKAAVKTTPSS